MTKSRQPWRRGEKARPRLSLSVPCLRIASCLFKYSCRSHCSPTGSKFRPGHRRSKSVEVQIVPSNGLLREDLAIQMLDDNRRAIERCRTLAPAGKSPEWAFRWVRDLQPSGLHKTRGSKLTFLFQRLVPVSTASLPSCWRVSVQSTLVMLLPVPSRLCPHARYVAADMSCGELFGRLPHPLEEAI